MAQDDASDLARFGYAQELLRDMGGFSSFAIAFSVVSILTGATQLFGYGLSHGGPLQISLGWGIVSFFTLFVAASLAELASAYPTAGALYHWSHFLGGRTLGWFTACFNTIGMFAILAGIDYGLSLFILNLLGVHDAPILSLLLYGALLLSHAVLNHRGIHLVSRLNDFSAWYHIVVVFVLIAALCFAGFRHNYDYLLTFHQNDSFPPLYSFVVGLLLAQWTFTGYDASAHVTEETVSPRTRAPWGMFLSVAVSIAFGFFMLAAVTLSISDIGEAAKAGEGAFLFVVQDRLGPVLGKIMVALVAGAMWLCGLAGMTSASRMVFAFARDGGLPFSSLWAQVNPKHKTPSNAIWGLTGLALLLGVSVDAYSAVVSIATIALYISYGLPIFARLMAEKQGTEVLKGPWSLGPASKFVVWVSLGWVVAVSVVFLLPPNDQAARMLGGAVVFLIGLWFFFVRKRFLGPKSVSVAKWQHA